MINGMLGQKVGMTQIFDGDGNVIPVTAIEVGPCYILELKEAAKKKAVLGFMETKEHRVRKPQLGYFKKAGVKPLKYIREFDIVDGKEEEQELKVGQEVKADVFLPGDYVDVSAQSIGKGFAGGMKRWGWGGGPASHGSRHHREVGSIGMCADPSRVYKGFRMAGHMGAKRVTTQNLRVMHVDAENNVILVKGSVPGAKRGIIEVRKALKREYRSLDEKKETVVVKRNPMKQSKAKAGK